MQNIHRSRTGALPALLALGCAAVLALLTAPPAAAQRFGYGGITSVGTFNGESRAYDINNNGSVVGDSVNISGVTRAFLWKPGSPLRELAPLTSSAGSYSHARAINSADAVVGGTGASPVDALIWSPPDYLPVRPQASTTLAYDINNNGQVVGRNGGDDNSPPGAGGSAFRYTPGFGTVNLGSPPGYTTLHRAYAINDVGYAVGWIRLNASPDRYRAAVWSPDAPTADPSDLGTLGGTESAAYDINNGSQIVGWASIAGGARHAFLFADANRNGKRDNAGQPNDEMVDLGTLGSLANSESYAISSKGYIVGDCYSANALEARRPFVWTFTGGMQDLNALIPGDSGWTLETAQAINDQGQVVGWGTLNGQRRGYVLTLTPGPVNLQRGDSGPLCFLTPYVLEYEGLITAGWYDRGPMGKIYAESDDAPDLTPLLRLFSPITGDHFYTISTAERDAIVASGWYVFEGIAGYTFAGEAPGRKPLLRAVNTQTGQHCFLGDPEEYNALSFPWAREGVAAWVLPGDPVPLYRGRRGGSIDYYFLTTSRTEGREAERSGWKMQGAVGRVYVSANDVPELVRLYRLGHPRTGDHFYTIHAAERDGAVQTHGYRYEGTQCYVFAGPGGGRIPLYRAVNVQTGQHLFSGDPNEYNSFPFPWVREGIVAYIVP